MVRHVRLCTLPAAWAVASVLMAGLMLVPQPARAQGENLALKAKATASGEYPGGGYEAGRANDAKETTRWNFSCAGSDVWLEYEWDTPQTIGQVVNKQAFDRIKAWRISAWDAAKQDYVEVFSGTGPGTNRIDINQTLTADLSPPVTTTKLRVYFDAPDCVSIWELEVYAPAKINLALTATASASGEFAGGGYEAYRAIDGKMTTRWNDNGANPDGWVDLEWSSPQTINKVVIKQAFDRIAEYKIQTWDTTKNDWVDAFTGRGPATQRIDINQTLTAILDPPVTTTKLRLLMVATNGNSIWELEAYNVKFGTISGVVSDASGKPIEGATVQVGDTSTVTDAQGTYTLAVDPGTVDIVASKAGAFKTGTARGIVVGDGSKVQRDITLFAQPPNLALTAEAEASSDTGATDAETGEPTQDAAKAIDGKANTRWESALPVEDFPETLTFTWSSAQTFNRVALKEYSDTVREYKLQRWDDTKGDYVDLVTQPVPQTGGDPLLATTFTPSVTTKSLRVVFTKFARSTTLNAISISEVNIEQAPLGTVAGKVVDASTGNPVANATVTADPGGFLGVTDNGGVFTSVLDADEYLLSAEAEGFFEGRPTLVSVKPDQTVNAVIQIPAKGENLARKAQVSASSEELDNTAAMAIDGDATTYWSSAGTEEGYDPGRVMNAWIQMDWTSPVTITRVIIAEFGDRSREILVQKWDDAKGEWVEVGSDVSPGGGSDVEILHTIDLKSPATTTKMRIFVPTGANVPRFREVEAYDFKLPPETPPPPPVVKGDANGDGKLTILDVLTGLRIVAGLETGSAAALAASDLNANGKIDVTDVVQMLRAVAGLTTL